MNEVRKAAEVLNKGGIIIFPTETVYGIGCLLNFPESIAKLYQIKKRDALQPTSVLARNLDQAKAFVNFNHKAETLARQFWPGPLTICLPAKENVPGGLLGVSDTLGIRIPGESWVSELLSQLNSPLLGPSANFKGKVPPTNFTEIDKNLIDLVDYVVEKEPGGQMPSTVIVFDNEDAYKVVREGNITTEAVKAALK